MAVVRDRGDRSSHVCVEDASEIRNAAHSSQSFERLVTPYSLDHCYF